MTSRTSIGSAHGARAPGPCNLGATSRALAVALVLALASRVQAQAQAPAPAIPEAEGAATTPPATSTPAAPPDAAVSTPEVSAPNSAQEEAEIAAELAALPQPEPESPPLATSSSAASGPNNAFNPAISANLALYGGGSTFEDPDEETDELLTGLHLQEVELRLSANVDPYFAADLALTASEDEIGFEEVFLSTLAIPRLTIRAGKMRAALGRHNLLHTHNYPFLTAPLPSRVLFGAEGLNDVGVSGDLLLPLPFYAEITAQVFQGEWDAFALDEDEDPLLTDRRRMHDFVYVGHLKTLFELGDPTTLELGTSYLGGRNGYAKLTSVVGGDITLKWRPIEAERYRGIDLSAEYLWVERKGAPDRGPEGGGYLALRYHFAQTFWLQGRGALLGVPRSESPRVYRGEALFAYVPSELSALRLQYAAFKADAPNAELEHEVFLQAVVAIGSHPAHAY